jgi:hypothetical protein
MEPLRLVLAPTHFAPRAPIHTLFDPSVLPRPLVNRAGVPCEWFAKTVKAEWCMGVAAAAD